MNGGTSAADGSPVCACPCSLLSLLAPSLSRSLRSLVGSRRGLPLAACMAAALPRRKRNFLFPSSPLVRNTETQHRAKVCPLRPRIIGGTELRACFFLDSLPRFRARSDLSLPHDSHTLIQTASTLQNEEQKEKKTIDRLSMVFLPLTPLPQDLNEGLSGARTCLFAAPAAQTRRVRTGYARRSITIIHLCAPFVKPLLKFCLPQLAREARPLEMPPNSLSLV